MEMPSYKVIDMTTFPRRSHFEYFRSLSNPYVGVTVNVDVTDILKFCKYNEISFYLTFMHAVALAADRIPQLRQRIRTNGIVEYEYCATSHTEKTENGTYVYCTLYHNMPFGEYIAYAERKREECRYGNGLEEDENVESMYFISSLPWLNYTQLLQPTAGGDESNPRITWGKYVTDSYDSTLMPVSILCNHALVDGIHLAQFYEELNDTMKLIANGGI